MDKDGQRRGREREEGGGKTENQSLSSCIQLRDASGPNDFATCRTTNFRLVYTEGV